MLSRLVILALTREIAVFLEQEGVDRWEVQGWTNAVMDVVLRPAVSVDGTRVLEDALCLQVRRAFAILRRSLNEQA